MKSPLSQKSSESIDTKLLGFQNYNECLSLISDLGLVPAGELSLRDVVNEFHSRNMDYVIGCELKEERDRHQKNFHWQYNRYNRKPINNDFFETTGDLFRQD